MTTPTPTLTITQLVPSQVVVGNPVQAQATLGGGALTGIVFFDVYGPVSPGTSCDANNLPGIQAFLYAIDGNGDGSGQVDGDGVYTSDVFTPPAPGTYFWEVHYTPTNTIDNPADEVCGPHGSLTVTSGGTTPQSITASANPTATNWTNTSTLSSSGYSGTGLLTYSLDSGSNGHTSSSVCQLSGATVSATGPGVCHLYATIAADSTYQAATSHDITVTFWRAPQQHHRFGQPHGDQLDEHEHVVVVGFLGHRCHHLFPRPWLQRPYLVVGVPAVGQHRVGHRTGGLPCLRNDRGGLDLSGRHLQ